MSLFKKNNRIIEFFNKIDNIENKIDILNSKFESLTFMDGCCDCRTRENKIYTDLKEYLDIKLLDIKDSLLDSIDKNLNNDTSSDSSSDTDLSLENLELKLKRAIEEIYTKNRNELTEMLHKCCETHTTTTKTDLFNLFNSMNQNLANVLNQFQIDLKTNTKDTDLSLRTDLQKYLLNMEQNFSNSISSQTNIYINRIVDINNQLTKHIQDLEALSLNIDKNVSGFYFENEIVKQQLQLSEDIRKYNDEIETLKTLANNATKSIDDILENFEHND